MPANFSSIVGEFMAAAIPKHCGTVVRNKYHNGHPDLIPAGHYHADSSPHGSEGIEIKEVDIQRAGKATMQRIAG